MHLVAAMVAELEGASGSRGAVRKVVLARDLLVSTGGPVDRRALVERLAQRFPDCWTFLCGDLVGATPELLVRRKGDRVESLVIAASVPRGRDSDEDEQLAALLGSDKHQLEHNLSVSSVTETLGKVCADLEVDSRPRVLRYDNVQHLASWIQGTLLEPRTVLELIDLLHPTPAVCGTPTELAMDRIRKLEGMERDGYSGPVGWVDAVGDGEMCIALRCAQLTPSGARLFAGAGIVVGSEPARELEETEVKFRAILSCLEDLA
jgi:menaquinone-specific isochorismate synthase